MSCENCEESAYIIDKLAKLLAEIAVIVNGPEPPLTRWSYHDLPEKVRALKEAQKPAAAVPAEPVAWQYRFATPDGLTWSDWQQISSEAMAREMVEAFGKAGTRTEWRSLKVFEWGGYAGECTDADFADEQVQQPTPPPAGLAAVPEGYSEDEIADACMMAEVSDSKYEAIIAYLGDNRRAMLAAALAERNKEQPR